jgi:non-specific protein-tyrosine kinase
MEFDLHQLIRMLRRWWWIAIVMPFAFATLAFLYTNRQLPKYSTTATMVVSPAASTGTLDYNSILSAERLSKTYQKLATNSTVLNNVIAELNLPMDAGELSAMISAHADGESQLLTIEVVDTDPNRAAAIANSTASQFQDYVVNDLTDATDEDISAVNEVIAGMKTEIDEAEAQIAALSAGEHPDDPEVAGQIEALTNRLDEMQGTYGQLLAQAATLKTQAALGGTPIKLAVPAGVPGAPFSPSKPVNVMVGFFIGAILAGGLMWLFEYFDNTVKSTSDFTGLVGTPLLSAVGFVPKMPPGPQQLFVLEHPKGGASESIRLLRTNIEFASATKEIAVLGITSANPSEGKSTIAANLAVTLAQAGFMTALVDSDLRRPAIHRIFGMNNDRGLSTVLSGPNRPWSSVAQSTMLPNLTVIPSGPLPPNPADLLSLERMQSMILEMRGAFDVIVLDTPPVLVVSDPLIVAGHVDGMIVVARAGKTRIESLKRATAVLQRAAVRIIGTIVNQQTGSANEGYYYTEYFAAADGLKPGGSIKSPRPEASSASAGGQ